MRVAACLAAATVLLAAACGGSSQYNRFVARASKLCSELPGPNTLRAIGQPTRAERELGALERADHNLTILRRALADAARRKKLQEGMRKARYEATLHRHDPRPYLTYEALYREDRKIYEAERTTRARRLRPAELTKQHPSSQRRPRSPQSHQVGETTRHDESARV
jgi:hypothetical protein